MKTKLRFSFYILFLILLLNTILIGQPEKIKDPAEIYLAVEKLNVLGSVLYVGAHPDDENTGVLAYFSKGEKYRTAYLALTRGDGGQNLIGSEKGFEIGILRTEELLQARSVDGAEQFFSRAIDFGYSKSPEETFDIWGKEEVLKDVVWVIRKFKPDVIITRFPFGSSGGHGHHTASAILAKEAFHAAADPKVFPEQLEFVEPWQAKSIYWNYWRPNDTAGLIEIDIGKYNSFLGKSYTEVSALSRSMHKSQGFGATGSRGTKYEYFQLIDGEQTDSNLFEDINTTWTRIENGKPIGEKINQVLSNFNLSDPSSSVPALIEIYNELQKLKNNYWVEQKKREVLNIIKSCAGLWMEAIAEDYSVSPGASINVKTTLVNRSKLPFKITKIEFPTIPIDNDLNITLKNNKPVPLDNVISIPNDYEISQPYWLEKEAGEGLFNVPDLQKIGKPKIKTSIPVRVHINYKGSKLEYELPLLYRWNDRVDGELYRPFEIRPPVTINTGGKVIVFPDDKSKKIQIKLKGNKAGIKGKVYLENSDGWKVSPESIPFSIQNKYDEKLIEFSITPPEEQGEINVKVVAEVDGKKYDKSLVEISYPHIPTEVYFPQSDIKLVRLDIKTFDEKIGYIIGSGDDIPEYLHGLGYDVTILTEQDLEETDLTNFDVIIAGIRAYNTNDRIKYAQPKLMEFVKNGGTFIVQYNVSYGLQVENFGPYPFSLSRDRITDENAELKFVDPSHQLLNFPNQITQSDFDGWVQERGLYFANEWDDRYQTILAGHDPGENDLKGSILFTKYGKGIFIYTGISWFRQLPAGVPGAYRLFVNLISVGRYDD